MNKEICIAPKDSEVITAELLPDAIFRYVKPSYVNAGIISDEAFQLRENRSPPEEFISFYYSTEHDLVKKLKSIEKNMCSGAFSFSKNGGLLCLSPLLAEEEINATRDIIAFVHKKNRKLKIGMHYLSKDPTDIIEARTALAFMSEFHHKSSF